MSVGRAVKKITTTVLLLLCAAALAFLMFGGPACIAALALGFRLPGAECALATLRAAWSLSENATCDLVSATVVRVTECTDGDGAAMCESEAIKATACVVLLRCKDGSLRNATSLLGRFDNHTVSHAFGTPGGGAADLCALRSARNVQITLNPRTVDDLNQAIATGSNATVSIGSLDACNELDSRAAITEFATSCVNREWWYTFCVALVSVYTVVICFACAAGVFLDIRDASRKGFRLLTDTYTPTPTPDGDAEVTAVGDVAKSATPAA